MAGLGYKVWSAGDILAAADVNGYLMQGVMVFDDAGARGSAIGTATEGMVSFRKDSNVIEVFDGSSWGLLPTPSPNYIINGAFDIWQRGTSFTSAAYTADRWLLSTAGGAFTGSVSQQTFSPNDLNISGYGDANYYARMSLTDAASLTVFQLRQRVEDVRTLAGQTFTFSFWAKADSSRTVNWSAIQNFGSGGSSAVTGDTASFSVGTTWQRFTYTETLPSISGKTIGTGSYLEIRIEPPIVSGMTLDICGVQLEAGSVATPFRRNANSIQGELAACQRYCQVYDATSQGGLATMFVSLTTRAQGAFSFPAMRAAPTATFSASNTFEFIHEATSTTLSAGPSFNNSTTTHTRIVGDVASGLTVGNAVMLRFIGGAGGSITLSAEL